MLRPKVVLLIVASVAFTLAVSITVGQGGQVFQPKVMPVANTQYLPQAPQSKRCKVLKVYDGDTLACDLNHNGKLETSTERVRLLSIDASEMSYSRKNTTGKNERLAVEAKQALEAHLGHTLELRYDTKPLDKYSRHLVFAYPVSAQGKANATSLNETLVQQGLARVWVLPPNHAHEATLLRLQNEAQRAKRGLWQ
jgi:endonuclease YncB( thermonuclease family)